jgi:hypothetical protein
MLSIVESCVIIHNMVVCKRRESYTGTVSNRLPEDETRMPTGVRLLQLPKTSSEQAQFRSEHLDGQEDLVLHAKLRDALADHIWNA